MEKKDLDFFVVREMDREIRRMEQCSNRNGEPILRHGSAEEFLYRQPAKEEKTERKEDVFDGTREFTS